ncbi:phage tail terminator family protein [Clostridium scatologenes]|uniref:Phage protein n=1 Tax=Clostridium scatologenes TaxID=1548 RepID=A0A0E3M9T4_CLOSL|nr:hypothetical protein [Clostridium scatologenes]AKA69840.1 hypothetical protein CSCA_2715 [Clostridium scatologenes]
MITFKDIKDAVTLKLSTEFSNIKVYDEEIRQGFSPPAFFIELIPVNTIRTNFFTKNPTLIVDVQYFAKEENNDELYDMADSLERSFKFCIQVKDRVLTIVKIEYEIVDFVLHFQISLNYLVSIREEVETEENIKPMRKLHFKEGMGK